MQREVAMKTITKTILKLKNRIEGSKTEKRMLLQTNDHVLQRSSSTRNHLNREKKTLVNNVPNRLIGISMKEQEAFTGGGVRKCRR